MKYLLTLLTVFSLFTALAQDQPRYWHIIVRMEREHNRATDENYWFIQPERKRPNYKVDLGLVDFEPYRTSTNKPANFFPVVKDSTLAFYNYFFSHTHALEFLSEAGWELQAVGTDVISRVERNYDNSAPQVDVSSRPVYYLRKAVPAATAGK